MKNGGPRARPAPPRAHSSLFQGGAAQGDDVRGCPARSVERPGPVEPQIPMLRSATSRGRRMQGWTSSTDGQRTGTERNERSEEEGRQTRERSGNEPRGERNERIQRQKAFPAEKRQVDEESGLTLFGRRVDSASLDARDTAGFRGRRREAPEPATQEASGPGVRRGTKKGPSGAKRD